MLRDIRKEMFEFKLQVLQMATSRKDEEVIKQSLTDYVQNVVM